MWRETVSEKPVALGISQIGQHILDRLESANAVRDRALHDGRLIVRNSAHAIRAIHRGEIDEAIRLVDTSRSMLGAMLEGIGNTGPIRSAGYVQDAMKEYAEAAILLAIVRGGELPSPESLGIDDAPYVNALAESASELRRRILDQLRTGDFSAAEQTLESMDEIYAFLITVDYPDGITGGLKRSTDSLRAVLERTRADLTITGAQNRLFQAIQELTASGLPLSDT
jgi:translin